MSRTGRDPTRDPGDGLAQYPIYEPPYAGLGTDLTRDQAEANFACFLASRPQRMKALSAYLSDHGLDLDDGLNGTDVDPFLDGLQAWTLTAWPSLRDRSPGVLKTIGTGRRSGEAIVFSMLFDLATAMGEMVALRSPVHDWVLDVTPVDNPDDAETYHRAVLARRPRSAGDWPPPLDFENRVIEHFLSDQHPAMRALNPIGRGVREALAEARAS